MAKKKVAVKDKNLVYRSELKIGKRKSRLTFSFQNLRTPLRHKILGILKEVGEPRERSYKHCFCDEPKSGCLGERICVSGVKSADSDQLQEARKKVLNLIIEHRNKERKK